MAGVGRTLATAAGGVAAVGAGCFAYGALWEVDAYRLRTVTVPVLPDGAPPVRILHLSDLHLTPRDRRRRRWVSGLADLQPDLVIDTGDNFSHPDSVPDVVEALGGLLERPGVYVWGSNDYFAPTLKNPLSYLISPSRMKAVDPPELPWRDLRDRFDGVGWVDLTHVRRTLEINGVRIGFRGTDDAHLGFDRYATVAGPPDRTAVDVEIGVTHAPYHRVIDAMAADSVDLVIAGHTHGGQVCVPFYGALVTNCDLDAPRVKGLSTIAAGGHEAYLHVSGGLGTSPYARFRFACPPEATLLTLVPASAG